ncbi:hypothetical protein UFOVP708_61 [uncultured Caudovirales phage]|uniref:Uncharacterized protein n=1 Tax=uncultured Caudovirales phage TaxID=2100421 RepID=A0A6J5NK15_9CAUD|nr:hypothetical protein UFOVP708_61 [uncultured Caudovirales phage]
MAGFGYGGAGAFMDGFNKEEERRSNSRADKRRKLQEMMDRAAAEGKTLTYEQMMAMADESGANAGMFGENMTDSLLEQMRESHNAKAKEAESKRRYDVALRDDEMAARIEKKVAEYHRMGYDGAKIQQELSSMFPPEVLKAAAGRVGGIAKQVDMQDFRDGYTDGQRFPSEKEAQEYISSSGLTGQRAKGVLEGARKNGLDMGLKADEWGRRLGASVDLTQPGAKEALTNYINANLPEALKPWADKVLAATGVGGMMGQTTEDRAIGRVWAQAGANTASQVAVGGAGADAAKPGLIMERAARGAKAAGDEFEQVVVARAGGYAKLAADPKAKLTKEQREGFSLLAGLMQNYEIDDAGAARVQEHLQRGDIAEARKEARRLEAGSRPVAEARQAVETIARLRAGDVGGGGIYQATKAAADALWYAPGAAQLGKESAAFAGSGKAGMAQRANNEAANAAAQAVRNIRQVLAASGEIAATQAEAENAEYTAVASFIAPYAKAAGIDPLPLIQQALNAAGPAQGYRKTAAPSALADQGMRNNTAIAPYLGGAGGRAPMPAPAPSQGGRFASTEAEKDRPRILAEEFQAAVDRRNAGDPRAEADMAALAGELRRLGINVQQPAQAAPQRQQVGRPQLAEADIARMMAAMNGGTDFAPRRQAPPPPPAPRRQINWSDIDAGLTSLGPMQAGSVPAPAPRPEMRLVQTPNGPRWMPAR